MNCPSCGFENPAEMKFCGNCAKSLRLPQACPSCGFENPPGFKFCGECASPLAGGREPSADRDLRDYTPRHLADKILQSKSALEGERKQVTVLFADVKGSMELAEAVDPEEWHRILDRFFQILTEGVHRFEGTVNQYTGDGIMALFGAPIAHEDHAQRACYAALHLRKELESYAREVKREHGLGFSVRMGIHSGEVVVGKIGDDLRMDYTAQGHAVGVAARMQELASPGTCYLTGATAALVQGFFELEDLGPFRVKGVAEAVSVYQLEGTAEARTRFDVARARGLTRFVGREADMRTLEDALEQGLSGAGSQVVGVVAEAGVGKSRLCFEFLERCRARRMAILQGSAVSHGKNVPFLPILQIFRAYYGIAEQDSDRVAREKIAGRLLLLDESYRELLPLLWEFNGFPDPERPAPPMSPEARQRQLFGVLRKVLQEGDPDGPSVTLIEDLHWIDAGSEAFLEEWVGALAGARGFLLVNFRPEYRAEWMGKSYYRQLPLAPLGPEATRELLLDLLGGDPSISGLAEAIHARTGGNPFFTEEVVQSLIEGGSLEGVRWGFRLVAPIERLEVPETVQSVLAARIDRLPEVEKHLLQTASVIGTEFSEPLLEAVAELPRTELAGALHALQAAEFVYEQALYPVAEYAFKHPLTQEVALNSQLRERRRRIHAAVARAIEAASPARLDEQAALLAHHWEEAGDARQAVRWHRRAAEWAGRTDPLEGVRHWQRIRTLASELPADEELASLRLEACHRTLSIGGWRIGIPEQEFDAIFAEGTRLAAELGDRIAEARLITARATRLGTGGNPELYYQGTREAEAHLEGAEDRDVVVGVKSQRAYSAYLLGRYAESLDYVREIRELAGDDLFAGVGTVGFSAVAFSWAQEGLIRAERGEISAACKQLQRGIELSRESGISDTLVYGLGMVPSVASLTGSPDLAGLPDPERACLESVELADALSNHFASALERMQLGMAHLARGRCEDAIARVDEGLAIAGEKGTALEWEGYALATRSMARLGEGDAAAAREDAEAAVAAAQARKTRAFGIRAELALAGACLAHSEADGEATGRALDRAEALIRETGARGFAPQVIELRARLARAAGGDAEADRLLRDAHRLFTEMGATGHAERMAKELGL